jgi:glycosyltransferase involved in cell wall biosynthesis
VDSTLDLWNEATENMTHITYVGNFLSKHGLNPTYSETLVPELLRRGVIVRTASGLLNPILRMCDMLHAVVRTPTKGSCVVVDLYSGKKAFFAAWVVSLACRSVGRQYVVVMHGGNLPDRLSKSRSRLLALLRNARHVVSPSRYLAEKFAGFIDVEVIPNALDVDDYLYEPRIAVGPRFLYLRAFHENYGPLTAVRAFARVRKEYPSARLGMYGPDLDGSLYECQRLVKELGLEESVNLSGRINKSQIRKLGASYDIFLNPTVVDNTPVSVVEAMAMGLCIVATKAGGLPYLLCDGETALLVHPGDDQEMATAMMRLLREPALASRLSQNARAAAEKMDWSIVMPKWVKLVQEVVDSAG